MKLQFRSVAIATSLIFTALALTLLFAPERLLTGWGLDLTLPVEVMCRRAAAAFLGIAVMLFSARNAEPSLARSALVKGVVVLSGMLAALGLLELAAGNVTAGILVPVLIEAVLALAFLSVGCCIPVAGANNKKLGKQS
jgi:hypothetical protein